MKASELRIGNLLKNIDANSAEYFVLGKNEMLSLLENENEYLSWVDTIPLTEEWLLKFGFYDKYKSVHTKWSLRGFSIEQASDQDEDGNTMPQKQEFSYEFIYKIKYVHQLQNLYFALTGEELSLQKL